MQNGYPLHLINKRIKKFQTNEPKTLETGARIILPYSGPLTTKLSHFLRRTLSCTFGYIPGKKVGNMICTHKQAAPTPQIGIYKIPCSCNKLYIGETCRPLLDRIKEHKSETDKVNITYTNISQMTTRNKNKHVTEQKIVSAVAQHIKDNPTHTIHFQSTALIESEHRYFYRKYKEGLYIKKLDKDKINSNDGKNINPIWAALLLPIIRHPKFINTKPLPLSSDTQQNINPT